jgi:hypothetical protein
MSHRWEVNECKFNLKKDEKRRKTTTAHVTMIILRIFAGFLINTRACIHEKEWHIFNYLERWVIVERSMSANLIWKKTKNDEKRQLHMSRWKFFEFLLDFLSIRAHTRKGVTMTHACVTKVFLRFSRNFWSIHARVRLSVAPSLWEAPSHM